MSPLIEFLDEVAARRDGHIGAISLELVPWPPLAVVLSTQSAPLARYALLEVASGD
jgi:hypothetical protein